MLVRVVHRLADADEELEPLLETERRLPCVDQRVLPAHELHREERLGCSAVRVVDGARLEDRRDPRVLQPRESLDLAPEAVHGGRRDQTRAQHLERDPSIGLGLARLVHDAHSALPEDAYQLELSHAAGESTCRAERVRDQPRVLESPGGLVLREQRLELCPKLGVLAAGVVQERFALARREVAGLEEELMEAGHQRTIPTRLASTSSRPRRPGAPWPHEASPPTASTIEGLASP